MTLIPRPIQPKDVETVRALHIAAWTGLAGSAHTPQQMAAHVALMEQLDYAEAILSNNLQILTIDGIICGTAGWCSTPDRPDTARIRKVFIHPDAAGKGLGRLLVHAAETASGRKKFTVRSNANAESFYACLGYRAVGKGRMSAPGAALPVVFMEKP